MTRLAIPCLTPIPADMLRCEGDCIVDPCEDGWPVVATWTDGEWTDPTGGALSADDAELFDAIRTEMAA